MSIKAGLNVTAAFGPVVTTATGDFAYSTSKQDAQKGSSNFARELVDKSVSKVQTETRTERTTRTHSEAEDTTTHGVDNVKGDGHIIGIYRWVDKRYRAQIYNYGIRLLLEFVVPEPAAFYRAARAGSTVKTDATPPAPFLNDIQPLVAPGAVGLGKVKPATPLTAADINENNYYRYAARYGASGISAPPPLFQYIGDSLVKEGLAEAAKVGLASDKFVVPAGYALTYYRATVSILAPANYPKFMLQIGTAPPYPVVNNTAGGQLVTTAHRATWRDRSDDRPSRWPHSLLGGLLRRAGLRRQP